MSHTVRAVGLCITAWCTYFFAFLRLYFSCSQLKSVKGFEWLPGTIMEPERVSTGRPHSLLRPTSDTSAAVLCLH